MSHTQPEYEALSFTRLHIFYCCTITHDLLFVYKGDVSDGSEISRKITFVNCS